MTLCALLGNPPRFRSPRPAGPGPGCSCLLFPVGVGGRGEGWGLLAPQVSLLVPGPPCPSWLGWEMASPPPVALPSAPTALALAGTSDRLGMPEGSLEEGPRQMESAPPASAAPRPGALCQRVAAQSGSPLGREAESSPASRWLRRINFPVAVGLLPGGLRVGVWSRVWELTAP